MTGAVSGAAIRELQKRDAHEKGFSLVEIVIALGIVSFALVAIFGLLPTGYKSAIESRRDTRSAFIAEQIVSDLRASSFSNATILCKGSDGKLTALTPIDLRASGTRVLACDGQDSILKELAISDYDSSYTGAEAEYLARIKTTPTGLSNLFQIEVEVSAPPAAPLSSRTRRGFFTFIGAR